MSRKTTITYEGLSSILAKFDQMDTGGTARLIKAHARLCAVQLALRTQPFSVGQKGKGTAYQSGALRVEYDIGKVVRTNDKLLEITNYIKNPAIQARMRKLIESGDYESVGKILKATKIAIGFGGDVEVLRNAATMKSAHGKHRNPQSGRTRGKTDKMYIATKSRFDSYLKQAVARVGRSKAGWADCARKINAVQGDGARGIPAWAKSASHGSAGVVNDNAASKPLGYVEMRNTIPWTDRICKASEQEAAMAFAKQSFIKSLQRSFAAAAKKTGSMADHIDQEINLTNEGE